ncbi:Crp/Fnr family transcriptional regulator [Aromatoleum petrolei]|uniref:Helix-turn-helix domain-containing protein n=1 Tax=Aromatoleum petrolei TaxID=76116 RepID=A0ABX1MIC9_9RHOO|nr:Crp/Fnr family transcriptional regulator [Aromatoleum petrolei]NMF87528.1 helix-turn-helix domain-containing protein [Aromatoleum petrolei]QTQ38625.1 Transcriptional regulator, crp-fnr family [Aromatoleum petrolei]
MGHAPPFSLLHPPPATSEGRGGVFADALAQRLGTLELFAHVGLDDLRHLAQGTRPRRLEAGESLWYAGERASWFSVIESGVIQIRQMTPSGEGILMGLFRRGEAVGLAAALEDGIFPADAIALGEPVELLSIRADTLRDALDNSIAVGRAINRALLRHTVALRAKIDIVSAGSVPRRLAALMHYLIERFGRTTATGSVIIDVHLARDELSQLVSARVETVIRILSRWQKAGWIASRPGRIEIMRPDMLERIVES